MSAETVVTPTESKYLKFIYRKQVEEGEKLRAILLSRSFDVRPATVTQALQKLSEKGMIQYTPYYGVELTDEGLVEARKLLRKHRILEVLFVRFLNYDAEKACEEASQLDHHCSEHLINAICRTLGHPKTCPCNKIISRDRECYEE